MTEGAAWLPGSKTHGTDDLVRSFKTKHQFIALLFAQLSGAHSLRDIHTSMSSHRARLYHAGAVVPARSTLADANRVRDPAVFSGLFMHMLSMTTRGLASGGAGHDGRLIWFG